MAKKVSIQGYIDSEYDPMSAPSEITVRRWCRDEVDIPGYKPIKIGGTWFLEKLVSTSTGNALVDRVLAG